MEDRRPSRPVRPAPELALAALNLSAVIALGRLFTDSSFFSLLAVAVLASQGLAWACRRKGLSVVTAAALSGAGLAMFATFTLLPSTVDYAFPTLDTWRVASAQLAEAWARFQQMAAPVRPEAGFLLAGVIAAWVSAFVSDWAAFRAEAALEAVVPSSTLFVFAAALGTEDHRGLVTLAFVGSALAFVLVQGAARKDKATAWFANRLRGGPQAIVRGGVPIAVAGVVVALAIGPRLPGADSPPLVDWRHSGRSGPARLTVSPLVDIRTRLVEQSDVEVFTVKTNAGSYWRLTSLDSFDGTVWGAKGSYRRARGVLLTGAPSPPAARVVQEFRISALESGWLPAAYRPERFEGPSGVGFDPDSASLMADAPSSAGLSYRVESSIPELNAQQLDGASSKVPSSVGRRYLQLPADFPIEVVGLARDITRDASTPYARALALQSFFRTNFTYSLEVDAGHDDRAIERFLRERKGYCEQFAGTYAAMARVVGLPARVAVGFTAGNLGADGLYHVTGRQAHAWPEVFLADHGWVPFEPTPGRGAPGARSYTGVPEQQETSAERGRTLAAPSPTVPSAGPTAPRAPGATVPADSRSPRKRPSVWSHRLVLGIALVATACALWAAGVPLALARRGLRRRAKATSAGARTSVAWLEALEALATAGLPKASAETNREYARRAGQRFDVDSRAALLALADDATAATFAPLGVGEEVAERAMASARRVVASARGTTRRRQLLLSKLDPRPLLSTRAPRPSSDAGL